MSKLGDRGQNILNIENDKISVEKAVSFYLEDVYEYKEHRDGVCIDDDIRLKARLDSYSRLLNILIDKKVLSKSEVIEVITGE